MSAFSKDDMRRVLECGRDSAPAFVFCPTSGMSAALTKALDQEWLVPKDTTFHLTDAGRIALQSLGFR